MLVTVTCNIRVAFLEHGTWTILLTVSDEASLDHAAPAPHSHAGSSTLPTMPQTSFACSSAPSPAATSQQFHSERCMQLFYSSLCNKVINKHRYKHTVTKTITQWLTL